MHTESVHNGTETSIQIAAKVRHVSTQFKSFRFWQLSCVLLTFLQSIWLHFFCTEPNLTMVKTSLPRPFSRPFSSFFVFVSLTFTVSLPRFLWPKRNFLSNLPRILCKFLLKMRTHNRWCGYELRELVYHARLHLGWHSVFEYNCIYTVTMSQWSKMQHCPLYANLHPSSLENMCKAI